MRRFGWKVALGLAMIAGAAQAADLTPLEIVNRHMAFAGKGDVDAMVADYADDAVTLVGSRATQGKEAIRRQFAAMFGPKPAGAAPRPAMQMQRVWQEGDIGFVSWTQGPVNGTDAFLVRHGKIEVQAVFLGGPPAAPAR